MKLSKLITLIAIFLNAHFLLLAQQNKVFVNITNIENKTTAFSVTDLNALPQTTLNVNGEDGAMHNYTGVDINTLLNKAGMFFGKEMRRQTLNSYMLIKAADNYSVLYALAEVDSFFSDKKMILASLKDGQPIPPQFGPLQIITTGEQVHARLIRMVTDIIVKNGADELKSNKP